MNSVLVTPRWTGLCWLWCFSSLLSILSGNWEAGILIAVIVVYETGFWTGGRRLPVISAVKSPTQPPSPTLEARLKEAHETLQLIAGAEATTGSTALRLAAQSRLTQWSWEDDRSLNWKENRD